MDCDLPIISKSKGNNLLECVICGVVGGEDNFNPNAEVLLDVPSVRTVDEMEIPGILQVGTFVSTITLGTDRNGCESHYHEQQLDRTSK